MRTKGSFEYAEKSENKIYRIVSRVPRTTNAIKTIAERKHFKKIEHRTVKRLLTALLSKGKIKRFIVGKTTVWCSLEVKINGI